MVLKGAVVVSAKIYFAVAAERRNFAVERDGVFLAGTENGHDGDDKDE